MRLFVYSMCLVMAFLVMPGCGGKKKTETAKNDSGAANTNTGVQNAGGNTKKDATSKPKQRFTKSGHPIPEVGSMGGGGGMTGGGRPGGNKKENDDSEQTNTNTSMVSSFNATGGLANGLFPQPGSSNFGNVFNTSAIGGGLFPQRGSGGSSSSSTSSGTTSSVSPSGGSSTSTVSIENPDTETRTSSGKGQLYDIASEAFEAGDGEKAMNYVYAHLLASEDGLEDYPMKWHASVKKPRVALRWGVGIVRGGSLDGRAPVIGEAVEDDEDGGGASSPEQLNLGAGGSRPGASGGSDSGPSIYEKVDTDTPTGLLLYYTGDFGEQLIKEFDSRRVKGTYFGRILKGMPEVLPANQPEAEAAASEPVAAPPSRNGASLSRNKKKRNLPSAGGMGGGAGPTGGGAPTTSDNSNAGGGGGGGSADTRRKSKSLVTRWGGTSSDNPDGEVIGELTPGLICLGEGTKEQLADRAAELGVDCLLIVHINGMKRKDKVYSNTRLRWIDMNTGSRLAETSNMSNVEVMKARQAGRKDPVESQLRRFFENELVDGLRAANMPNIDEDAAANRVSSLVDAAEQPLRDAVEVLWYYREGLLPENEAVQAVNSLLDGVGKTIITGSEKQKMDVVSRIVE